MLMNNIQTWEDGKTNETVFFGFKQIFRNTTCRIMDVLMNSKKSVLQSFLAVLCLLTCAPLHAQTTYESLRDGDAAYDRSNYSKAEPHYRRVTEKEPSNWNAAYNLGNALYQQGKYEEAGKIFEKAVVNAPDTRTKADALHNAGNALLKQNKFKEAAKAYENSLRLRPGDADTKMNLQMAKKKDQQEQQRQQQEQQQQNQEQNKQDSNQQNQNQQNQNQQQQNQQNQQQNQQQSQPNSNQKNTPPQQPQQQQESPSQQRQRMKEEEARRLLETSIGPDDKKNARKYRSAQQRKRPAVGRKDW